VGWHRFSNEWSSKGFCAATRAAWEHARWPGVEWVFWLEHDFLFKQYVDLRELAAVMEAREHLKQMALMREPVGAEIEHGGFVPMHPGAYVGRAEGDARWLETQRNWTTNPSLFPRSFAVENDWPTEAQCEGHFGFQVREREPDATFGLWGEGEPWVEHIGVRTGHGY
jgi:hypothetical protein